jgi:hypothetical protein
MCSLHLNSLQNSVNKYRRDSDIKEVYGYQVEIILFISSYHTVLSNFLSYCIV